MSKKYNEMTIKELFNEKQRLIECIKNSKGNFIAYKQNKQSLLNVEKLIIRKVVR